MFPIVIKFQCSPHSLSISVVEHVGCIGYAQLAVINAKHLNNYIFVDFFSSPVSLYSMVLRVLRPSSGVHRPASSVRSITPTVLKIISPYCIHIFVMYIGCAQKILWRHL